MILRGVGRAIAGLALVAAVSACDDNPLAENRDAAEYLSLSVSNAVVEVGGEIGVVANVKNRYGASLVVNVTASECDAGVSVKVDTVRSAYEFPERFIITGNSVGESCVIVSGAGLSDTIDVRVVPAALTLTAPADTVGSGETVTLSVGFLGATGAAAPGVAFNPATTSFVVRTAGAGVIDETGEFFAQAPGTTWIVASYTDFGVTRRDSVQLAIVPGTFNGSAIQTTYAGVQAIQFTAGGIPFDANTRVEFLDISESTPAEVPNSRTATTISYFIPPVVGADSTITFHILQAGPDDLTIEGQFTTGASAIDGNDTKAGALPLAVGDSAVGVIMGVRGSQEWYEVTVAVAGTYRISFRWLDNLDKDAYVENAAGATLVALENGAATNPETDTVVLAPGTYYIRGETWTPNPGADAFYVMKFTLEL